AGSRRCRRWWRRRPRRQSCPARRAPGCDRQGLQRRYRQAVRRPGCARRTTLPVPECQLAFVRLFQGGDLGTRQPRWRWIRWRLWRGRWLRRRSLKGRVAVMNPSALFIMRPVATSLLMIAIMLAGIVGFLFLPLAALPEVAYPTIQVKSFYPGASPTVMANSVTAVVERQFGQMAGLKEMSSISSGGSSIVTLTFNLDLD